MTACVEASSKPALAALYRLRCYDGDWLVAEKGDFPVTAKLVTESLAQPIQAELAVGDIDYICDSA